MSGNGMGIRLLLALEIRNARWWVAYFAAWMSCMVYMVYEKVLIKKKKILNEEEMWYGIKQTFIGIPYTVC